MWSTNFGRSSGASGGLNNGTMQGCMQVSIHLKDGFVGQVAHMTANADSQFAEWFSVGSQFERLCDKGTSLVNHALCTCPRHSICGQMSKAQWQAERFWASAQSGYMPSKPQAEELGLLI